MSYFFKDYHTNAEKAKRELDGTMLKGRTLKIRFAPPFSAIKVKNLTSFVSNELLHCAFSIFGEVIKLFLVFKFFRIDFYYRLNVVM